MAAPQPVEAQQRATKRYTITKIPFTWRTEIRLENDTGKDKKADQQPPPDFVIETSSFTRHKADVTLHIGPDAGQDSPTVACVFMPAFARHFKIGVCSPGESAGDMAWEEMRAETLRGSEFSLHVNLDGGQTRRRLLWKRTSRVAVDGEKARRANHNWKLVDCEGGGDGGVVAVFTTTTRRTISGTLQFNVSWGDGFEHVVMATLVALYETPPLILLINVD